MPQPDAAATTRQYQHPDPDGPQWLHLTISPLTWEASDAPGMIAMHARGEIQTDDDALTRQNGTPGTVWYSVEWSKHNAKWQARLPNEGVNLDEYGDLALAAARCAADWHSRSEALCRDWLQRITQNQRQANAATLAGRELARFLA